MKTTKTVFGIVAVALAATIAGCGSSDDAESSTSTPTPVASSPSASNPAAGQERVVGYSNPQGSEISLQSIGYGAEEAIDELDLPWSLTETDADLSADKQVSDIDTFISQQTDGILSWTLNSGAMEPAYSRAREADIPVFGLNSDSESIVTNIMTETDSTCNVAQAQASYIAERIPGANVIAIEGPEVPTITFTTECFFDAAAEEGLNIIASAADTSATESTGQQVAADLLTQNQGEVDAVWVFADQVGVGASAAIVNAGLDVWSEADDDPSGVIVVSRDGASAAIENIRQGRLTATWDGNMSELGAAAIQLLERHYVQGVPLDELPEEVLIEATQYDATNVENYEGALERDVPLPID